jgi:hypothetical protein
MPKRLTAVRTPCTPETMFDAMGRSWVTSFKVQPSKPSLIITLCQWVLETGWGKSCWDWNIGNFRSRDGDGRDWCLYECDERLKPAEANAYIAKVGTRLDGSGLPDAKITSRNKDGTITVYFWPDNPMCRFRAFSSMDSGVLDYLTSLNKRFYKAWPSVISGDPDQFIHQLKLQRYFTADEETYRKTFHSLFNQLIGKNFEMKEWAEIHPDEVAPHDDDHDGLTDDYRDRVNGLVALTLSESLHPEWGGPNLNA